MNITTAEHPDEQTHCTQSPPPLSLYTYYKNSHDKPTFREIIGGLRFALQLNISSEPDRTQSTKNGRIQSKPNHILLINMELWQFSARPRRLLIFRSFRINTRKCFWTMRSPRLPTSRAP